MFEIVLEKLKARQKLHGDVRVIRYEHKDESFWKGFVLKGHHKHFFPIDFFLNQRDLRLSSKLQKKIIRLLNFDLPCYGDKKIWLADGFDEDACYDIHYDDKIDNIRKSKKVEKNA